MGFAMPEPSTDTATLLRELEASAPNPVPKTIKAAMIQAAKELEQWRKVAENSARINEECCNVRISQMASTSAIDEQQRGIKGQRSEVARCLRALT